MPFFHITSSESLPKIMELGLKGTKKPRNRGEILKTPSIFVLLLPKYEQNVCDYIAINQIWVSEDIGSYEIVKIKSKGVTGKIDLDHVAERSAPLHRIIRQQVIEPKYLEHFCTRNLDFPGKKISEIQHDAWRQRKLTPEEWAIVTKYMQPIMAQAQKEYEAGLELQ